MLLLFYHFKDLDGAVVSVRAGLKGVVVNLYLCVLCCFAVFFSLRYLVLSFGFMLNISFCTYSLSDADLHEGSFQLSLPCFQIYFLIRLCLIIGLWQLRKSGYSYFEISCWS